MGNQTLYNTVIRVSKEDSAFTYFQLEANENLCFYSTLDTPTGASYRDISLSSTPDFAGELERLLQTLGRQYPIERVNIGGEKK